MNYKAKPGDPFPTEYDFSKAPKLKVPGDWNTQRESLCSTKVRSGTKKTSPTSPSRIRTCFFTSAQPTITRGSGSMDKKSASTKADLLHSTAKSPRHIHSGNNFVVAAVDNTRHEDNVPTLETDWWNYGGLTREVSLIELPDSFIDQYDLHLSRSEDGVIEGWVHVVGAQPARKQKSKFPACTRKRQQTSAQTAAPHLHFNVQGLERWTPESPKLYKVAIHAGSDSIDELMGFRTIETRGTEILLNGKPIFLRGISIHAEAPYRTGRAYSDKDAETLLGWAKELGCNYVRLAHYPHDETMLRAADRMGLLVWSENPVYWALEFDNPKVLAKAEQQLDEEINTSRNHAAIILWSMANETPNTPARTQFIETLATRARGLDPTRLITAALLVRAQGNTKIVDDPLGQALDVIGINEYIGWYEGHPDSADTTQWQIALSEAADRQRIRRGSKGWSAWRRERTMD